MQVHNTDVVIVGGGAAGCYAGLNLHRGGAKTIIVCKGLDYRFRESCHKRGIHLSFQAPMCAGALRTKD
jgi:succinate dehydrogenase/fumarate reductase flavoprotein subunit